MDVIYCFEVSLKAEDKIVPFQTHTVVETRLLNSISKSFEDDLRSCLLSDRLE